MASMMIPDLSNADQMLVASPYDDGIEGNPIGELQASLEIRKPRDIIKFDHVLEFFTLKLFNLQELCMNRRLPPPGYEVSLEEGQPHERKFVIVCIVGKSQEAGAGKSKKVNSCKASYNN